MTEPSLFFGLPIRRGCAPVRHRVPQQPMAALRPLFEAVLGDPVITSFGWRHHLGDGEGPGLRVGPPWFRTAADSGVHDLYELSLDLEHPSLGGFPYARGTELLRWVRLPYRGPDEARFGRAGRLAEALESGAFDRVLARAFGTDAAVSVRRSGIQVTSCRV